ncbi:MAG TPA: GFA family protein [Thermoleophilaceae bacterium]
MSVLSGGCLCGAVRYEVSEPFESANYCHCTRCQRRTGAAASANARTAEGSFRIVKGEDLVKCWDPGDGGFPKCFCSNCGSALYSRHPDGGQIGVRLGTVDGDPGIRPQKHQFTDYAAVWEPIPDDGLPRFPESSRSS